MSDWKSLYAGDWKTSAAREIEISTALASALGVTLLATGVGAGQTGRVKGYGKTKGEADYASTCGRLHIEITGPLQAGVVSHLAAIWIRPDKLAAAEHTLAAGELTVLAHNIPAQSGPGLTRYIPMDADLLSRWRAGEFKTITRCPRGAPETYVEIPAREACSLHIALPTMRAALGLPAIAVAEIEVPVTAKTMATAMPYTAPARDMRAWITIRQEQEAAYWAARRFSAGIPQSRSMSGINARLRAQAAERAAAKAAS